MFSQFLANFTWLDVCIIIMAGVISYRAFHQGVLVEIFKIAALLCAIFTGLHFYLRCGDFFYRWFAIFGWVNYLASYVILIALTIFIFYLIRSGIMVLVQEGEKLFLSRLFGLVLGLIRAVLLSSLLLVGCLTVDHHQMTRLVRRTFASRFLLKLTPKMYSKMYYLMIKPAFPDEPKNARVLILAEKNSKPIFD